MPLIFRISILFLLLTACKSYVPEGAEKQKHNTPSVENPYFSDPAVDYVYKARVEAFGESFGGLFIVKKQSDTLHRIVISSDLGNKMLDMELTPNGEKINFIMEALDRKTLRKMVVNDFRTLLTRSHTVTAEYENTNQHIYKSERGKHNYFLFFDKKNNQLSKIIQAGSVKEKVNFIFDAKNNTFADTIRINHHKPDVKIYLTKFKNNK